MQQARRITSIQAWFATGTITALFATIVILLIAFLMGYETKATLYVVGIYEAVHLLTYLVIGMPLFLYFWPRIESLVWRIHFSLPIGFMLGYLGMLSFFYIFSGFDFSWIDKGALIGCLFGGLYGLFTALAAWGVFRLANKSAHTNPLPAKQLIL